MKQSRIAGLLSSFYTKNAHVIVSPLVEQLRDNRRVSSLRETYECFPSDLMVGISQRLSKRLTNIR